ncbi:MAG TPA: oxidoreductase [Dehalococcoidia bacterium]|nr:NADH-quinone oxidoreductase subunit M [SAR202 cluster bacterium]MQG57712.1 NADH-quinone oxidoreductase subunit M [SAR202 cluster bacterium]HAL49252.1 oxidoreductase [Dehalococcoidia bacterium]
MFTGWLTALVFLPMAGAIILALVVRGDRNIRFFAAAVSLAELVLAIVIFAMFDHEAGASQYQLIDKVEDWIPIESFKVQYFLGIDGVSAPMVLLTGLLGAVAVYSSWSVKTRVREYFVWLLALQAAVMGVFTALDFFLFFMFWELELVPMFFLISIWGSGRREYSAMKFVIFTILGSAFMLVGILVLFYSTDTFDMTLLPDAIANGKLLLPIGMVFTLTFIAFAVKLPIWPLHTWLPDAHTDAPTAASVMLAGVLLKMGAYGMIRVSVTMFPGVISDIAWLLAAAGVVNILYGAVVVLRQTDLKRLIAFSSISHMGFVLLGLSVVVGVNGEVSAVGLTGAALQMFTHGTITGLLFLLVGYIYEKAHTRYIPDLGGLAGRMPLLTTSLVVAGLASLGLPSTSGFVAEIHVFLGAFPVWSWLTAVGAFGVVITAGYILWMIQRSMFGPRNPHLNDVADATPLEMLPVAAMVIAIMAVGIYPSLLVDVFSSGLQPIVDSLQNVAVTATR